jgi:hypothetical protein
MTGPRPSSRPGWARAWWRHWGDGSKPWLLTVRDGTRVVGLAPLRKRRVLGLRMLRVNEEPGDHWDVLAVPEYRFAVEEALGDELRRRAREWDALVVARLPGSSSTASALERVGFRTVHRSEIPCPGMELPGASTPISPPCRRAGARTFAGGCGTSTAVR